jgi:hypothetical protein
MKKLLSVVSLALLFSGLSLMAQQPKIEIPQRTDQERWNRCAYLGMVNSLMVNVFCKSKGMTVEEIGDWLGKQYAPGWSSNMTPQGYFLGFHRNAMTWPTAVVEVTAETENEVTFRSFRAYVPYFGEKGILYGVTIGEYEKIGMIVNKAIAEHGGLQIEEKIDGMWWVTTVSKKK